MKKRLTSILLTVCMIVSIFCGLGVTAYADMKTTEYTLKAGDNVYSVCRKLGIDFYANYDWITNTNKITNYSSLGVGRKIILPLGEVAAPTPTATPTPTTPPSTTVTTPAKNNVNLLTGDTVVSYLVPYVVSSGDTMYDICLREGINYTKDLDYVMKINGLKNASRIQVGRTLLLPTNTMPTSGACVAVVAHKIVSGDATYNLCGSYKIDYEDNVDLMKALNGKSNMASIKTGQTLLIPVPTSITPSSTTVVPGTNNSGNTGSSDKTEDKEDNKTEEKPAEPTPTPTPTPAPVSYKITKNTTNTNHGSYSVLVNNSTSSDSAKKGDTVTVNVKPNKAYALDYVKVVDKNGNAVSLNETTFTMPESDVTISVVFVSAKQYKITSDYANNGTYVVTVNGVETTYASEGQTVKISPTPKYNYEFDSALYYESAAKWPTIGIIDKQFVMPAYDVTISVAFRDATPHEIARPAADNGTYQVKCNGTVVKEAKAGQVIDVVPKANDGYEVKEIRVVPKDAGNENTVTVTNGSFVMPEFDVKVLVTFKAQDFNIKSAAATNGSFTVLDGSGKEISSADTGAGVYVKAAPATGYAVDKVTYTDYNGKVTEVSLNGDYYYFTMPACDVTVNVTFKARVFYLAAHTASPAVTFTVNSKDANGRAYMGETVTVDAKPADGVEAKEIKVLSTSNLSKGKEVAVNVDITKNANGTFSFKMPSTNVTIKAIYELEDITISKTATSNGSFSFKKTDVNGAAITTAHKDDIVYVATAPNDGYQTASISVVDGEGKAVTKESDGRSFKMPANGATVTVTFVGKSSNLGIVNSTPSLGTTYLTLSGSNTEIASAKTGETVKIVNNAVNGYKLGTISVVDANGKAVTVSNSSFVMPASAVTVTVNYVAK